MVVFWLVASNSSQSLWGCGTRWCRLWQQFWHTLPDYDPHLSFYQLSPLLFSLCGVLTSLYHYWRSFEFTNLLVTFTRCFLFALLISGYAVCCGSQCCWRWSHVTFICAKTGNRKLKYYVKNVITALFQCTAITLIAWTFFKRQDPNKIATVDVI